MKILTIIISLLFSINNIVSQTQIKIDTNNTVISIDTIKSTDTTIIVQSIFSDTMPCEEVLFKLLGVYME